MSSPDEENAAPHPDGLPVRHPDGLLVRLSADDRELVFRNLANPAWAGHPLLVPLQAIQAAVERAEIEQEPHNPHAVEHDDKCFICAGYRAITADLKFGRNMRTNTRVSATSTPSSAASPPRYHPSYDSAGDIIDRWLDL